MNYKSILLLNLKYYIICQLTLFLVSQTPSFGQVWNPIGYELMNNGVNDLIEYNTKLYAGGSFYSSTNNLNNIAFWDGTSWNPLLNGMVGGINAMEIFNGDLIVAGGFQNISGIPNARKIASWNGNNWNSLGLGVTNGSPLQDLKVFQGELFVAGRFSSIDSLPISNIARWDGNAWHPVCTLSLGLSQLFALAVFDNELYIGGYFWSVNGIPMSNIAKFDGTNWVSVGGGIGGDIFELYADTINNRLYASGNITSLNGGITPCSSNVAYWDGTIWHSVGNGPALNPRALMIFNNELYVGFGSIQVNSSGDSLNCIAKWNGIDWKNAGKGLNCNANAFLPFDGKLIVGGCFTLAGDSSCQLVAGWSDTLTSIHSVFSGSEVVNVYPNPFSDIATVILPSNYSNYFPCTFTLFNNQGIALSSNIIHSNNIEISKKALTSGIYYYYISCDTQHINFGKLIIK